MITDLSISKNQGGKKNFIVSLLITSFLFTFTAFPSMTIGGVSGSDKIFIIILCYSTLILYMKDFLRLPINYVFILVYWVGLNVISSVISSNPKTALVFSLNYIVQLMLFLSFIIIFSKYRPTRNQILRFIYKFSIVVSIIAIIEKFYFIQIRSFMTLFRQKNYLYGRSSSLFDNPNHLGIFLALMFIIGLYFFIYNKKKIYIVGNIIIILGLLFAGSRSALLALFIGILLLLGWSNKYKIMHIKLKNLMMIIIVLIILSIIIFSSSQFNRIDIMFEALKSRDLETATGYRATIWRNALVMFKDNLVFGVGSGNFQQEVVSYMGESRGIHSMYLSLLVENGLVGFLLFIIFLIRTWNRSKFIIETRDKVLFKTLMPTLLITQITEMQLYNVFQFIFIFWFILSIPYSDMISTSYSNNR